MSDPNVRHDRGATHGDVVVDMAVPVAWAFAVLADGWTYASWVVGASHIRAVDDDWPAPGSRIHHSVGPWPVQISDVTQVVAVEAPRLLVLDAKLWPLGAARVKFTLDGENGSATVSMSELVTGGPAAVIPVGAQRRLIAPRNRESLRRLARLAEARHDER